MAAWRIIDLTQFSGSISSKTGAIVLHPEDKPQVVLPVADVAVVLVGMGVKLSGAVLHRLTAADVCVLLCDWRGIPEAGAFAWRSHSRVAARRVAQAGMS
ncbi:MAG: type II CRISPR-associated endonuclease Cas1, partial [Varibaculum cambriense]|nr:type II CRISPR-associated endonuclease Cas1 [Varibaculum cambriense]